MVLWREQTYFGDCLQKLFSKGFVNCLCDSSEKCAWLPNVDGWSGRIGCSGGFDGSAKEMLALVRYSSVGIVNMRWMCKPPPHWNGWMLRYGSIWSV
jgi:hypothetical protein